MVLKSASTSSNTSSVFSSSVIKVGRRRKLYCCNGHYLEIGYNGAVKGSRSHQSQLVVMEIIPVGKDNIQIRGAHTGFYLAIDSNGGIYTTRADNKECLLQERFSRDFFDSYVCERLNEPVMLGVARTGTAVTVPLSKLNTGTIGGSPQHETRFITMKIQ